MESVHMNNCAPAWGWVDMTGTAQGGIPADSDGTGSLAS